MLKLFALGLVLLGSASWAKCSGSWVRFEPEAGVALPRNAQVIVSFGVSMRDQRATLESLSLVSGKDRVPLKVVATHEGMMSTQLVLKATRLLTAGLEYHLALPKSLADTSGPSPTWKVSDVEDTQAPVLSGDVTVKNGQRRELGCGPDVRVELHGLRSSEPTWLEVTLTHEGKAATQVVPLKDGVVTLGHGMCSGSFVLLNGVAYEASLVPLDLAGNRSASLNPIRFVGP